jgi:Tol biopolymer transport system component
MTGEKRILLHLAGTISLLDVTTGGRALLALNSLRHGIAGLAPGEAKERDLSWFDLSVAKDLSADGRTVLFDEAGSNYGRSDGVYLRGTNGSPAVRLGPGVAGWLSPDGKWALTLDPRTKDRILLPTGPGEPRILAKLPLANNAVRGEFPDGRRILFSAREQDKPSRLYERNLAGGTARPLTPYGFDIPFDLPISPDGHQFVAWDREDRAWIYPVESGTPRLMPGYSPGEDFVRWSGDGRAVFLWRFLNSSIQVFRLNVATGERRLLREISFPDPAGLYTITNLLLTPDGSSYVYSYGRMLSTLYLVEGLK